MISLAFALWLVSACRAHHVRGFSQLTVYRVSVVRNGVTEHALIVTNRPPIHAWARKQALTRSEPTNGPESEKENIMEKRIAFLRVVGNDIKPYTYTVNCDGSCAGESNRVKAVGGVDCGEEIMPASFYFTTPSGEGVVPPTGDWIKVTIERATREEMESLRPGYLFR